MLLVFSGAIEQLLPAEFTAANRNNTELQAPLTLWDTAARGNKYEQPSLLQSWHKISMGTMPYATRQQSI